MSNSSAFDPACALKKAGFELKADTTDRDSSDNSSNSNNSNSAEEEAHSGADVWLAVHLQAPHFSFLVETIALSQDDCLDAPPSLLHRPPLLT